MKKIDDRAKRNLRRRILMELRRVGVSTANLSSNEGHASKDEVRLLHARQRTQLLARQKAFVMEWQTELLEWFAHGTEVEPREITPRVVQVRTEEHASLFRFASLHWSVPVSRGYGRRTRFLVVDGQNEKLIGIFALGDPVYNLTARDQLIGWNVKQRNERLYNVLDAFVLGAVPPYRQLLGGKLVAMTAVSDTTREIIKRKYQGRKTTINKEVKQSRPVLITTTSALGRSSLYNRLKFKDSLLFQPVGYTRGFGHFQFSEPLFQAVLDFLGSNGGVPGYKFGMGPNWRIRTIRVALKELSLDKNLIQHGIRREVFLAPLARKWKEYLRGETNRPEWHTFKLEELAEFFRNRWAEPRAARDPSYLDVRREDMALIRSVTRLPTQRG
jgi:hypothetical protein